MDMKFKDLAEPRSNEEGAVLSELYTVREQHEGDKVLYSVRGPFNMLMKAEVVERAYGKTLRLTEFHFANDSSVPREAPLQILKELLKRSEEHNIVSVEIPVDADTSEKMLQIDKIGMIVGSDELARALKRFERHAEPQDRSTDPIPLPFRISKEEFTNRLKTALHELSPDNRVA